MQTTSINGFKQETEIRIKMSVFQIFALLMCKGNLRKKAETLFEIASGSIDDGDDCVIAFNSERLTKAFKNIIFFSEIFPKKYQNEFINDINDKLNVDKKRKRSRLASFSCSDS